MPQRKKQIVIPKRKKQAVKVKKPDAQAQKRASTRAKQEQRNTSAGRAHSKGVQNSARAVSKMHGSKARDLNEAAKKGGIKGKELKESAKKQFRSQVGETAKRGIEMREQNRATRANKMPKESVPSERLSSRMQSTDYAAKTPKKPQAIRGGASSILKKAGPIGAAATVAGAIISAARAKAESISKEGVGGTENMKNIRKFRAKTPSQAYKKAQAGLAAKKKARAKK